MISDTYIQWYNANAGRSYPLQEDVTQKSDDGLVLPTNLIVDLGLLVPSDYPAVYLSSVYITPRLLSVGFNANGQGLLAGTYLRAEIQPYKAYPLTSVSDNTSGWIVFGDYTTSNVEHRRFSGVAQSAIDHHAIRFIDPPPVTKILQYGADWDDPQTAEGLIQLKGSGGLMV